VIPHATRLQVGLPTPAQVVAAFIAPEDRAAVEPVYRDAILREVEAMVTAIPAEELAIQWDVCREVLWLTSDYYASTAWFDELDAGIVERLAQLADAPPDDVEIGFHFCAGDFRHGQGVELEDLGPIVELANAIARMAARPLTFVHLAVSRNRDSSGYLAPLADLALDPETEVYLGIIHASDGLLGAERRAAVAARHVAQFGVAAECGIERQSRNQIVALLDLHRQVARPWPVPSLS
jgi:methionine synthase II (cobalamin-independent)